MICISMKCVITCSVLLFLLFSCKNKKNDQSKSVAESAVQPLEPEAKTVSDSMALTLSKEILTAVKNKDYQKFASFIEPHVGVRFSPYAYIDTVHHRKFSTSEFLKAVSDTNTKLNWGTYDGSGEEILLTVNDYFKKFVYDADFVNAEQTSLNKTISKGNSLNNIDSVYKHCIYTEFYFSGFEKQYQGMDWRSLKLVFKKEMDKLYLVAVIHDQWTI